MKTKPPSPDLMEAGGESESTQAPNPGRTEETPPATSVLPPAPEQANPMDCPHMATGADLVVMAMRGASAEDSHSRLTLAIAQAAEWVSRNAPELYTLARAGQILRGLFRKGGE